MKHGHVKCVNNTWPTSICMIKHVKYNAKPPTYLFLRMSPPPWSASPQPQCMVAQVSPGGDHSKFFNQESESLEYCNIIKVNICNEVCLQTDIYRILVIENGPALKDLDSYLTSPGGFLGWERQCHPFRMWDDDDFHCFHYHHNLADGGPPVQENASALASHPQAPSSCRGWSKPLVSEDMYSIFQIDYLIIIYRVVYLFGPPISSNEKENWMQPTTDAGPWDFLSKVGETSFSTTRLK